MKASLNDPDIIQVAENTEPRNPDPDMIQVFKNTHLHRRAIGWPQMLSESLNIQSQETRS